VVEGVGVGKPLYGVDGNLLVARLPHDHEVVETILNGAFKPAYWGCRLTSTIAIQLRDERAKRAHRKAYRAHLEDGNLIGNVGSIVHRTCNERRPNRVSPPKAQEKRPARLVTPRACTGSPFASNKGSLIHEKSQAYPLAQTMYYAGSSSAKLPLL